MTLRDNPSNDPDRQNPDKSKSEQAPEDSESRDAGESLNRSFLKPEYSLSESLPSEQAPLSIRFVFKDSVDESAWAVDQGISIDQSKTGIEANWLDDADSLKLLRLNPGDNPTVEIWRADEIIPENRLGILPSPGRINEQNSFSGKIRETQSLNRVIVRNSQGKLFLIPATTVNFFTGAEIRKSNSDN